MDPGRIVSTKIERACTVCGCQLIVGAEDLSRSDGLRVPRLTQSELASRWRMSERTLERHRHTGVGIRYLVIGRHVVYRLEDVEAYELANLRGGSP